jgi:hypothetical protein
MDLERAETFTPEFKDITTVSPMQNTSGLSNDEQAYNRMDDEEILDEETINWTVLVTRVFAFFLLFLVVLFCALEEISIKFVALAAIVCIVLILVIVATYIDIRRYFLCCCKFKNSGNENTNESEVSSTSTNRNRTGGTTLGGNRTLADYDGSRFNDAVIPNKKTKKAVNRKS